MGEIYQPITGLPVTAKQYMSNNVLNETTTHIRVVLLRWNREITLPKSPGFFSWLFKGFLYSQERRRKSKWKGK